MSHVSGRSALMIGSAVFAGISCVANTQTDPDMLRQDMHRSMIRASITACGAGTQAKHTAHTVDAWSC